MSKQQSQRIIRTNDSEAPIPDELAHIDVPRIIDIQSFRKARNLQLEHFVKVLSAKSAVGGNMGNKLAFQLLPKHMRRRAMSHNSFRVPARARKRLQSKALLKNGCRRARRHTRKMLADYERRNKEFKWLQTHIWHAKRMRMVKQWGWSVPMSPFDKSIRAVFRFAKTECVITDHSYYEAVRFTSDQGQCGFLKEEVINGVPVDSFDTRDGRVFVFHPSGTDQIQIQGSSMAMQFTLFRLRGPKSAMILQKVLRIHQEDVRTALEVSSEFTYVGVHDRKILDFTTDVPRSTGRQPKASREYLQMAPSLVPKQPSLTTVNSIPGDPSEFWHSIEPGRVSSNVPSKITTRSVRSRYNAGKQGAQKKAPEDKIVQQDSHQEDARKPSESVKGLLVFRKGALPSSFCDGWDLYLPAGRSMLFWKALIYAGGKAIGSRDYDSLLLQQGKRAFPQDYPGTLAYQRHLEASYKDFLSLYFRRPPAKRTNYFKMGFPVTLPLLWTDVGLTPVCIKAKFRVPKERALICKPHQEDLVSEHRPTYTEPIHVTEQKADVLSLEGTKEIQMTREVIGFVTSACLSFVRSKGFAIGFLLPGIAIPAGSVVLFRNHSSRHYHKCTIAKQIL